MKKDTINEEFTKSEKHRKEDYLITLREMNEADFRHFLEYFIADYAKEIEENYKKNKEEARSISEQEIRDDLPEGLNTKDNVLLCIDFAREKGNSVIGFLWYRIDKLKSNAFIYDFYIQPEHRSRGYGKESMALLEERIRIDGIRELKLRVAATNEKALALYKELDFFITGINMTKKLI